MQPLKGLNTILIRHIKSIKNKLTLKEPFLTFQARNNH